MENCDPNFWQIPTNSWTTSTRVGSTLSSTNRKRYVELTVLAKELCEWMEKKGVTKTDFYTAHKLIEDLWYRP